MALSETTKNMIRYLQAHPKDLITASDIADYLGVSRKAIDGAFTSALQRKALGYRMPGEIEQEDGLHKRVSYLYLTPAGLDLDLDEMERHEAWVESEKQRLREERHRLKYGDTKK